MPFTGFLQSLFCRVLLVEQPEACAHDSHAAHEVSEGNGDQVFYKKADPCKPFCGKTVFRLDEEPGGDVEHVGDAVLKAAEHENHDRRVERGDLSGNVFGAHRHPYGDADEDVAEDGAQERVGKAQGCFCRGGGKKVLRQRRMEQIRSMAVYKNGRYKEGAKKVSEVNEHEVFDKPRKPDLFIQKRNDHKAVSGKKLAARKHDHRQTRRENDGGNEFCCGRVFKHGTADGGSRSRKGDEHSRKKAEDQKLSGGKGSLADAGFGIIGCDIG